MWPNTRIKLDAEDWPEDLPEDLPEDSPEDLPIRQKMHHQLRLQFGPWTQRSFQHIGIEYRGNIRNADQLHCSTLQGPWSDAIRSQIFFLFASQGYAFLNLRNRWRQVLHNLNLCIFS
jgi:hypothetical protein